jgi:hypothetical protein
VFARVIPLQLDRCRNEPAIIFCITTRTNLQSPIYVGSSVVTLVLLLHDRERFWVGFGFKTKTHLSSTYHLVLRRVSRSVRTSSSFVVLPSRLRSYAFVHNNDKKTAHPDISLFFHLQWSNNHGVVVMVMMIVLCVFVLRPPCCVHRHSLLLCTSSFCPRSVWEAGQRKLGQSFRRLPVITVT